MASTVPGSQGSTGSTPNSSARHWQDILTDFKNIEEGENDVQRERVQQMQQDVKSKINSILLNNAVWIRNESQVAQHMRVLNAPTGARYSQINDTVDLFGLKHVTEVILQETDPAIKKGMENVHERIVNVLNEAVNRLPANAVVLQDDDPVDAGLVHDEQGNEQQDQTNTESHTSSEPAAEAPATGPAASESAEDTVRKKWQKFGWLDPRYVQNILSNALSGTFNVVKESGKWTGLKAGNTARNTLSVGKEPVKWAASKAIGGAYLAGKWAWYLTRSSIGGTFRTGKAFVKWAGRFFIDAGSDDYWLWKGLGMGNKKH